MSSHQRIGEVAKRVGVSPELLRKMEREGKLPPAARTVTGFRAYDEKDVPKIARAVRERFGKVR